MIFENHSGAPGATARQATRSARSVADTLAACAAEAERHATALARLDSMVGEALGSGRAAVDPRSLQMLDLLRQEAEGLARVLSLAVSMPTPDAIIGDDEIARRLPLAAQRARFIP